MHSVAPSVSCWYLHPPPCSEACTSFAGRPNFRRALPTQQDMLATQLPRRMCNDALEDRLALLVRQSRSASAAPTLHDRPSSNALRRSISVAVCISAVSAIIVIESFNFILTNGLFPQFLDNSANEQSTNWCTTCAPPNTPSTKRTSRSSNDLQSHKRNCNAQLGSHDYLMDVSTQNNQITTRNKSPTTTDNNK